MRRLGRPQQTTFALRLIPAMSHTQHAWSRGQLASTDILSQVIYSRTSFYWPIFDQSLTSTFMQIFSVWSRIWGSPEAHAKNIPWCSDLVILMNRWYESTFLLPIIFWHRHNLFRPLQFAFRYTFLENRIALWRGNAVEAYPIKNYLYVSIWYNPGAGHLIPDIKASWITGLRQDNEKIPNAGNATKKDHFIMAPSHLAATRLGYLEQCIVWFAAQTFWMLSQYCASFWR